MIDVLDLANEQDIQKLRVFSLLDHPDTFRYFKNRVFDDAIKTHVVTLLYSTYGYAHIDRDSKSGRYYLGVCVMPEYQGKGIGKKLLEMLFNLHKDDTYLTVDKKNTVAISLYEKYDFKRIDETETSYTYKRCKKLLLEVSIGEAIDKLTILDIKVEKISNPDKKLHCQKEFDSISVELSEYLNKVSRFYKWLRYINLQIWNLQDEMREKNNYSNETFHKILDLNDMRFRVKKRINSVFDTSFQEQKGYSDKVGIFLTHLGMGDIINMNGAIRYAALLVDKLYVICKQSNSKNAREMLADDPTIHIIECKNNDCDVTDILQNRRLVRAPIIKGLPPTYTEHTYIPENITHRFLSGGWAGRKDHTGAPDIFYDDLRFPREVRTIFSYFNTYEKLPIPSIPYIFTHASSSFTQNLNFKNKWDIHKILTIDPNKNYYEKGHMWYDIAEGYVNKPIFSYFDVIRNSTEIHVTDSSFFCLALYTNSTASVKVCYDRTTQDESPYYKFDQTYVNQLSVSQTRPT